MTKTTPVDLTLEETGTLLHLLLPRIQALVDAASRPQGSSFLDDPSVAKAQAGRMNDLYNKLAEANDKLAGKT